MLWIEGGRLLLTSASVFVAAAVGWVGYMQWRTNADKLRLDLYDRRFEIYSATIDFYQIILARKDEVAGVPAEEVVMRFIKAKQEAQFLFDPESGVFEMLTQAFNAYFLIKGSREEGVELSRTDPPAALEWHRNATNKQLEMSTMILKLDAALGPYLNYHTASGTKFDWRWMKSRLG